jgi:hypothetical protein
MPNSWVAMIAPLLVPVLGYRGKRKIVQKTPPWSRGANDPAMNESFASRTRFHLLTALFVSLSGSAV